MLSQHPSSDKDANASQSSVVYYGNTKELQKCLGEKMTLGKVGTRWGEISNAI
jgi:hypothetical protein